MSLAFPDVNVWLALSIEHMHQRPALDWWAQATGEIGFCRFTQLGLLRLLTTSAVMDRRPLDMRQAWRVYELFFEDDRVEFVPEPAGIDSSFRRFSSRGKSSPKLWADAYLLAMAEQSNAILVTFDRVLARRAKNAVHLL